MKKSYLMIAAAAGLMLTACTSEDDYAAQNAAVEQAGDGAVLFDTYLSNSTTRAGQEGTMTTSTLQSTGFGIIAITHALGDGSGDWPFTGYAAGKPNFMYNQKVEYKSSNWVYDPLKYWPNETKNDQQTDQAKSDDMEGVSFFAYAPYVANTTTPGSAITDAGGSDPAGFNFDGTIDKAGLIEISKNDLTANYIDPKVYYKVADGQYSSGIAPADGYAPSNSVDLLWGVSSGFQYHPVKTNSVVTEPAGLPVKNMMKPQLEEKIKFDFKHALARIGLTVVGAFDQKAQGGSLDKSTKVTIKEIEISATSVEATDNKKMFATAGILNLNNTTAHRALWESLTYNTKNVSPFESTIKISSEGEMNPNLKWKNDLANAEDFPRVGGVTSVPQNVIVTNNPFNAKNVAADQTEKYDASSPYFTTGGVPVTGTDLEYKTATGGKGYLLRNGDTYTYTTAKTVSLGQEAREVAAPVVIAAGTKPANAEADKIYLKKISANVYNIAAFGDIPTTVTADTYYTIAKADFESEPLDIFYKAGDYQTVNTAPGYFMVIPATIPDFTGDQADVPVTVKITYYVTTNDPQLGTTSHTAYTENVISQQVTLEKFTNGKSYNLKLILGLTSVKVDAEVSNWEVGTVESNLPQNLE